MKAGFMRCSFLSVTIATVFAAVQIQHILFRFISFFVSAFMRFLLFQYYNDVSSDRQIVV